LSNVEYHFATASIPFSTSLIGWPVENTFFRGRDRFGRSGLTNIRGRFRNKSRLKDHFMFYVTYEWAQ
jgi:hypothetical protein